VGVGSGSGRGGASRGGLSTRAAAAAAVVGVGARVEEWAGEVTRAWTEERAWEASAAAAAGRRRQLGWVVVSSRGQSARASAWLPAHRTERIDAGGGGWATAHHGSTEHRAHKGNSERGARTRESRGLGRRGRGRVLGAPQHGVGRRSQAAVAAVVVEMMVEVVLGLSWSWGQSSPSPSAQLQLGLGQVAQSEHGQRAAGARRNVCVGRSNPCLGGGCVGVGDVG
jgi:hypothetical protein